MKKAKKWWQLAADAGNSKGMYSLGLLALESGDLKEAKKWWQLAADAGDSNAMTGLGALAQESGDMKKAKKWWQLAADAGEPYAMTNLGELAQESGDLKEAKKWFQLAAEAGEPNAMTNLGELAQESGDLKEAKKWWQLAAEAGESDAMYGLGLLAKKSGDVKEAKKWFQLAAEAGNSAGNSYAMFFLGRLAKKSGDLKEAKKWFQLAAEAGNSYAMLNLGPLAKELGDLKEAKKWWQLAAEAGDGTELLLENLSDFKFAGSIESKSGRVLVIDPSYITILNSKLGSNLDPYFNSEYIASEIDPDYSNIQSPKGVGFGFNCGVGYINIFYLRDSEDPSRVAALVLNQKSTSAPSSDMGWMQGLVCYSDDEVGDISIDSGQLILSDLDLLNLFDPNDDEPWDLVANAGKYSFMGASQITLDQDLGYFGGAKGFASSTGYGDGYYSLFEVGDCDWEESAILINFLL
jgi:TPR repeat protein